MTIPTISTLPVAPARTDAPATFITRADAFLAAIVTMQSELNTSIGAMNTDIAGVNADATAAAASASAAATSESNASTSETNAATSETNAASSAAAAASTYDQFDDRYLGSKASDPAVDNDGNALLTGALYFNSTSDDMKVYTGTTWKVTGFNPDSPTFTDTVTAPSFDINSIAATNADTAVDVFVYDTRKDSDGGAWRKRTQHTSWYNETLNTATRGSRKEFPAVAVIVAESTQVTIYDGDDPSLPMWMVFNWTTNFNMLGYGNRVKNSVFMLNGGLFTGSSVDGVFSVNFITEKGRRNNNYGVFDTGNAIVNRNVSSSNAYPAISSTLPIISQTINDVAMTVLPNAPIDAATGLPVPTIAVATDGGVSVIKDDGTVVDITGSSSVYNVSESVGFQDGYLLYSHGAATGNMLFIDRISIPSSDTTWSDAAGAETNKIAGGGAMFAWGTKLLALTEANSDDAKTFVPLKFPEVANGNSKGASLIHSDWINRGDGTDETGLIANTTSNYNTGWMNGDIKLATLSDTDDTNITGSELVTNGDFATDSDWIKGSNWTISSGVATTTGVNSAASARQIYQANVLTVGATYTLSVTIDGSNITGSSVFLRLSAPLINIHSVTSATSGTYSITFVATSTTLSFTTSAGTGYGGSFNIDNVSVRLAVEDRSVNDKGLQVFGTITKTPVATGADLVAYSGFSASNYLEQPTNTDIISLSSYCFIGWVKTTVTGTNQYLFSIGTLGINSAGIALNTSGVIYAYDPVNVVDTGNANIGDSVWHQVVLTYDGSTKKIYIDGKLDSSFSASTYSFLSTDTYKAGTYTSTSFVNIMQGSISLQRLSATIPTAEQIAKIYEDEKFLFQENAQATLYGSSDAVTALAYDDDTELLHVGTSAGRSVFQGLRRVDNTTGAVGAAISASNGLVAED